MNFLKTKPIVTYLQEKFLTGAIFYRVITTPLIIFLLSQSKVNYSIYFSIAHTTANSALGCF